MAIKTRSTAERVGICIITFMLTSMLGMACGGIVSYRIPVGTVAGVEKEPVAAPPGSIPSPRPEADQIIAGHHRGFSGEDSFFISGLTSACEPYSKVLAMDEAGNIAVTTAAGDGSFVINAVPPGFEVKPGSRVYLSQIVPHLGESIQVPLRIAGN